MNFALDKTQREQCTIEELTRVIFCFLKKERHLPCIGLEDLQNQLCPRKSRYGKEDDDGSYIKKNKSFLFKFYEAIGRLKQRGLLMEAN